MTSSIPVLLAPLVAGYAFSSMWAGSLYYASREQGHRLYFRAVFYAFFLIICSALVHAALHARQVELYAFYVQVIKYWLVDDLSEASGSRTAILLGTLPASIVLAGILSLTRFPPILNFTIPHFGWQPFLAWERLLLRRAIQHVDFERLVSRSFFIEIPLMVTLQSQKIYVGWVVAAPNPVVQRRSLRILPILSGYREPTTHEVRFTTDYIDVLDSIRNGESPDLGHLTAEDLEVVMPTDGITSAHLFDFNAYEHFCTDSGGAGEPKDEDA